jgi:hypothetical protein
MWASLAKSRLMELEPSRACARLAGLVPADHRRSPAPGFTRVGELLERVLLRSLVDLWSIYVRGDQSASVIHSRRSAVQGS